MSRPGIEPWTPGTLANALTIMQVISLIFEKAVQRKRFCTKYYKATQYLSLSIYIYIYIYGCVGVSVVYVWYCQGFNMIQNVLNTKLDKTRRASYFNSTVFP